MMQDVASEPDLRESSSSRGKKRHTAKEKGKMKARPMDSEDARGGDEADNDDRAEGTSRAVPGPLSQEALMEIRELGDRTMKDAEALAQKYRKNTRTIMVAAGLGVQHSRHSENIANKFKTWYAHEHPIGEDGELLYNYLVFAIQPLIWHLLVSFLEYVAEIHEAYQIFQAENPITDKKAYEKACKPIYDYCKSLEKVVDFSDESTKSMVTRMNNIKDKFTELVCLLIIFAELFLMWH